MIYNTLDLSLKNRYLEAHLELDLETWVAIEKGQARICMDKEGIRARFGKP